MTNTTVPAIYCASPFEFQGRRVSDLAPRDFNCITAGFTSLLSRGFLQGVVVELVRDLCPLCPTDFAVYETFPFHSVSVESYEFSEDQFVVFAQPDSGFCTLYIWDHVEMTFKKFHNITCKLLIQKIRANKNYV